jgi:hypothetical protein
LFRLPLLPRPMAGIALGVIAKLDEEQLARNNRIGARRFLNQHCVLVPDLESILLARTPKIVLQHERSELTITLKRITQNLQLSTSCRPITPSLGIRRHFGKDPPGLLAALLGQFDRPPIVLIHSEEGRVNVAVERAQALKVPFARSC